MGCYDIVRFKCPRCDKHVTLQSKAGSCDLELYSERGVPPAIAAAINGSVVVCSCGKRSIVQTALPSVILCWLSSFLVVLALLFGGKVQAQVRGQNMKDASTMEAFDAANRELYGTGRTSSKSNLAAYYTPGSQRGFVVLRNPSKRVWFEDRKKAAAWAKENKYVLVWTVLTPKVEQELRFRALDKAPVEKYNPSPKE